MVRKKGQAAMEFLMTYGWAILVVLAAIGALAYFGVLSPDRFLPDKCTASPPFACTQYKVDATNVSLVVTNNGGTDLVETTWYLSTNDGQACSSTPDVTGAPVTTANGAAIGGGTIAWEGAGCAGLTSGDKFNGNFTIVYKRSGEDFTHTSTGSIQARVE